MSDYPRIRKEFPCTTEKETEGQPILVVSVTYKKRGINYSDYKTFPSGYYASVQPITRKAWLNEEGKQIGNLDSFVGFTGYSVQLAADERFNKKKLADYANLVLLNETVLAAVKRVCAEQGILPEDRITLKITAEDILLITA